MGTKKTFWTVSEVARMANISVRALHHYDEIGLLSPSRRSAAGYRQYAAAELRKLQQIMSFKVLGFPLEEIRRLLDDPKFDVRAALELQRRLLDEKEAQIKALIAAVDAALASLKKGRSKMTFQAFSGFDPAMYEEEAKERWGDGDAYRESARRTARYTDAQWAELKAEAEAIYRELAAELAAGAAATSPPVRALAERHRLHIERWFYPCTTEIHRGLGDLYVSDPRFTATLDRHASGLAVFLRDAILANAEPG